MKKLSTFALFIVALLWGGTTLAICPAPDHDIHLHESVCVTVCFGDYMYPEYTTVSIITPYPHDSTNMYPPEIIILPGCGPDTPCNDDPDCEHPCDNWPAAIDTQLTWGCNYPIGCDNDPDVDCDSAYWGLIIGNMYTCMLLDTFCVCVTFDRQLPVELTALTATAGDGEVQLNWTTATEMNNDHWDIERATSADGPWVKIHEEPGQGTVNTETNYVYVDRTVQNGTTYWYRLTDVTLAGERASHPIVSATPESPSEQVPGEFALKQNFPNPFNPTTTFEFAIAEPGYTTLKIYNLLGREVASVVEEYLEARLYHLTWGAGNLPSGVYLYTLTNGNFSDTRKLLLMK